MSTVGKASRTQASRWLPRIEGVLASSVGVAGVIKGAHTALLGGSGMLLALSLVWLIVAVAVTTMSFRIGALDPGTETLTRRIAHILGGGTVCIAVVVLVMATDDSLAGLEYLDFSPWKGDGAVSERSPSADAAGRRRGRRLLVMAGLVAAAGALAIATLAERLNAHPVLIVALMIVTAAVTTGTLAIVVVTHARVRASSDDR